MAGERHAIGHELRMIADDGSPSGYPPRQQDNRKPELESEPEPIMNPYGSEVKPAPDYSKITRQIAEGTNVA